MTQCSVHAAGCERTHFCPTRPHWRRINLAVGEALAAVTLADMAAPIPTGAALTQETTLARPLA
jgi:hypothetical protein